MILPQKHIKLSESLFALGGLVINEIQLDEKMTIDELWIKINLKLKKDKRKLISDFTFDNLILSLDYLYLLGLIEIDKEGRITK